MKKTLFFLISCCLLASCGGIKIDKFTAIGKPYEVLVVTPKSVWEGPVGQAIRTEMEQEVLWVNQPEPLFTLSNIPPNAMNTTLRTHRNIFMVDIDPTVGDSTRFSTQMDKWSGGQVVVRIQSPSVTAAADYITENIEDIAGYLSAIEQNRFLAQAKGYNNKVLEHEITQQFGIRMTIPQGYTLANQLTDYLWIKYEMRLASQGIVIYSFDRPAAGQELDVIAQRNHAVGHIPGPLDGTYMTTDMTFRPESIPVEINGVGWIETRGFWKVQNDFMGGPFINFVALDPATNRYIGIDLYVYSPDAKHPKRNFIRGLEGLMLGVSLPTAPQTTAAKSASGASAAE